MSHVLLGGIRGYLPDRVEECQDYGTAIETAAILYALEPMQVMSLAVDGMLDLDFDTYGSEYLEIQESDVSWHPGYLTS